MAVFAVFWTFPKFRVISPNVELELGTYEFRYRLNEFVFLHHLLFVLYLIILLL